MKQHNYNRKYRVWAVSVKCCRAPDDWVLLKLDLQIQRSGQNLTTRAPPGTPWHLTAPRQVCVQGKCALDVQVSLWSNNIQGGGPVKHVNERNLQCQTNNCFTLASKPSWIGL